MAEGVDLFNRRSGGEGNDMVDVPLVIPVAVVLPGHARLEVGLEMGFEFAGGTAQNWGDFRRSARPLFS